MTLSGDELQQKLAALRETYMQQLPDKFAAIQADWHALMSETEWRADMLKKLHRLVHSLAGSGGTFGYAHLSEQARVIEERLKPWLSQSLRPPAADLDAVTALLQTLPEAAQRTEGMDQDMPAVHEVMGGARTAIEERLIYLVEDDQHLAEELALQVGHFGYRVDVFNDTASLEAAMRRHVPAAVIMDIVFPEGRLAGPDTIARIKQGREAGLPVLFISARNDMESRLESVRAGGDAYFSKPVDINALVDRLDVLTERAEPEPFRILIVDDDRDLAAHYALVLENAGMSVRALAEPMNIMQVLVEDSPELILMDVYLPECTGMDLAKVIRQQEAYLGIPIVFLSTENDVDKQFAALGMGGDDFLAKPISNEHLVSSVLSKAQRARELNSVMVRDSLTGLLKHTRIKEQLEVELSRARRQGAPLAFAMLDIDGFKAVNDTYGHLSGDRVIKSLARVLRQRVRASDCVGRYGGEEFAVIFPDTGAAAAAAVLDDVRSRFADILQRSGSNAFTVTFSAGVSEYPACDCSADLIEVADKALYRAKQAGRNRICLHDEAGSAGQAAE